MLLHVKRLAVLNFNKAFIRAVNVASGQLSITLLPK